MSSGLRGPGLVADAPHGQYDLGVLRVVLDLRAQPLDVHVDQPCVRSVPVAPDLLQQHLAREDLPGLAGQADEQVELERRERDGLPGPGHLVPGHVDVDVADGERLGAGVVVTPGSYLGPSGEGYLRFALVPTEEECAVAVERLEGLL